MSNDFYDRDLERKKLIDIVGDRQKLNAKVIFLYGYSGVGKSCLIDYLLQTVYEWQPHIQVFVPNIPHQVSPALDSCEYFNRLYDAILKKSKLDVKPDDSLLSNPLTQHRINQSIHLAVQTAASVAGIDPIIGGGTQAQLLLKRNFIVDYLRKTPHVVDIQNIQAVDLHSWEFLKEIMEQAPKNAFVLEYTLSDEEDSGYLRLCNELKQARFDVKPFRLKRLNDTDALKLLPHEISGAAQREYILDIYHKSRGNLCQIILFRDTSPESTDYIREAVSDMIKDRAQSTNLFLLNLVYLHKGHITENDLRYFATSPELNARHPVVSEKKYAESFEWLRSQKFLQERNGELFIHDSILNALDAQRENVVLRQAYQTLVLHYMSWRPEDASQQIHRLSHLFFLYLRFEDSQLLSILPDIRRAILSSKYPQAACKALQEFISTLRKQPNPNPQLCSEVYTLLTEICIETGDENTAWEMLNSIPDMLPEKLRVLKGRIYELGMGNEEVAKISSLIEESAPNSRERLLLELSRLHVAMRVKTQTENNLLILPIIENETYKQYYEYAFILSDYAELVDSPRKAIDLYHAGIRLLVEHGQDALAGCLYANICMSYGYLGEIDQAAKNLELAKLQGVDEPVYLNNLVALELLRRNVTQESAQKLKDALLLHANRFERLIIHNNLLIVQVLLKNWAQADAEYKYLKYSGFESFQYGEFLHLCYQNLLFYSVKRGLKNERAAYTEQLKRLCSSSTTSEGTKAVIQAMLSKKEDDHIFYSRFPYRAEFLCYWGIPTALR
ncbi:MAG: ATP-binding protein [Oscillospiraceae bacterium]|nr:ATP-binding protein [Oscillospiraceae bacterium]